MNVGDAVSDTTFDKTPHRRYDRHFSNIDSKIDILHKLSQSVEKDRKRNRVIVILIGTLVLVAEFVSVITKMIKE